MLDLGKTVMVEYGLWPGKYLSSKDNPQHSANGTKKVRLKLLTSDVAAWYYLPCVWDVPRAMFFEN
jgi:hypothetical protein